MALAWILRIEYSEALEEISVLVELLDEDDTAIGPRLEATLTAGRPPGSRRGAPISVPLQWTLTQVELPGAGGYRFRICLGDRELASVPFRVLQHRQATG